MAQTKQKKIVFSKGQIAANLVERTDVALYDKSAQVLENFTSTVYGGVRSRRGTFLIDKIQSKTSGEATSYMGGDADNIQNGKGFVTSAILTDRDVFMIDYGEEINYAGKTFYLSGIKSTNRLIVGSFTDIGNQTFTNPAANTLRLKVHGGGGGGSTWPGGAGAYFEGDIDVSAGSLSVTVGDAGAGAGAYSRNNNGQKGGTTAVTWSGGSISCEGGQGAIGLRNGDEDGGASTFSYAPVYMITDTYNVIKASAHVQRQPSWNDWGRGSGGNSAYSTKSAGFSGAPGMVEIDLTECDYVLESSTDGVTWTTFYNGSFNQDAQTISTNLNANFRYIRMRIDEDAGYNIGTQLAFDFAYLSGYNGNIKGTKLLAYTYNNSDKYVLLLSDGIIKVYLNGVYSATVAAAKLTASVMEELKYTYQDDTIIFTHPDIPPQILKNNGGTWSIGDLQIENVPYALFGNEVKASKSVPIKPSATEGSVKLTADSSVFDSSWVGQYIDGGGGKVKITAYESATVVSGNTVIPFYTDEKINEWTYISGYEQVWSALRGYPRTCLFAQQRLWFGGSKGKPSSVWASRIADYYNFKNSGNYDNDAISIDLLTNAVIVNMVENRGIHIFTSDEEITVSETNLTPDGARATTNTKNGSLSRIAPVVLDGAVVFVEKNGKSLLSYIYNDEQAAYTASNLSLLSNLMNNPLALAAEINSAKDKGNFLYLVLSDGRMLVTCLLLDQEINSPAQFVTEGKVVDVCCSGGDTFLLVARSGSLYLEKIGDILTDCTTVINAQGESITVDDVYQGFLVYAYNDDFVETHTVNSSSVALDLPRYGNAYVGLPFEYNIDSNPININGHTFDIKKRIAKATVVCKDTPRLTFNNQSKSGEDVYCFYACTPYKRDVRFNIHGKFYPVNVLSVTLDINYGG